MIEKFDVDTPFGKKRRLHIYLPNDYYESNEEYPVMYMYDGHNLYDDRDATYGKSWGLSDFLNNYDKKFIVVGIECSHDGYERLDEYCPYTLKNTFLGPRNGYGNKYMEWVVYQLKPMIDQKYRTIPFRECTGIAGSSMGGLMAYYTIMKFNQYFSKAACLSPSLALCHNELFNDFQNIKISPDTRVYFSFGTKETKSVDSIIKNLQEFHEDLLKRQASSYINIVLDGEHNEATWEKQNQIYFDYLWK